MSRRVVIVGAGIAGLTTAAMLSQHGVDVDVLERRDALPEHGTALGMWPSAVAALDRLGCGDELRRIAVPQSDGSIRRHDGAELVRARLREATYLISRPRLLELLYRGVPAGSVAFGTGAERLDELTGYDVVVAADGSGSRLRNELWGPAAQPRPLPLRVWRGALPGRRTATEESWGPGALWGLTPREDDRTNWFACVHHDLVGDCRDVDVLAEVYGQWHADVRDAVTAIVAGAGAGAGAGAEVVDGDEVLVHDLTQSPRLRTLVTGRVALVGDAAHTMAPNLGRGACEAILDGVRLGRALVEHDTVPAALHAYDRARRRSAQRLVTGAYLLSRLALADRGTRVRDGVLRGASRLAAALP